MEINDIVGMVQGYNLFRNDVVKILNAYLSTEYDHSSIYNYTHEDIGSISLYQDSHSGEFTFVDVSIPIVENYAEEGYAEEYDLAFKKVSIAINYFLCELDRNMLIKSFEDKKQAEILKHKKKIKSANIASVNNSITHLLNQGDLPNDLFNDLKVYRDNILYKEEEC